MSQMDPSNISGINLEKIYEQKKSDILKGKSESSGFKEILGGFMKEVNDLQLEANDKIEKLASGEIKDVHEVMIAATEAETSFKIMMDIHNKLLSAYKEIMKMG